MKIDFKKITYIFLLSSLSVFSQLAEKKQSYIIGDVSVSGNTTFSPQTIVTYSGLGKGEKVTLPGEKISNAIKKLWGSNLFSSIEIFETKKSNDTVFLEISLVDLPELTNLIITGIKKNKTEDIIRENKLQNGVKVTENLITTTKNYLENSYRKKGFLKAKVTIKTEAVIDSTTKSKVNMFLDISKGSKVKLEDISFIGNEKIKSKTLLKAMKNTKKKNTFRVLKRSKFIKDDFKEDLVAVVDKYKENGYRDARILIDTLVYDTDTNMASVSIKLEEQGDNDEVTLLFSVRDTGIGMNEEQIDHLVTVEGICRVDILEMMTLDQVKEIPSQTDTMAMGDALLLIHLKQWCSWHRRNPGKGKLPHVWELVFDEDTLYEFDAEASQPFDTQSFESARSGSKKKLFGTEDLEDEDESTFKVKLSDYPKFDGKQSSWLNFKKSFEAIAEAAGFSGEMQVSLDDASHESRRSSDIAYDNRVKKLHVVLQAVTASGSALLAFFYPPPSPYLLQCLSSRTVWQGQAAQLEGTRPALAVVSLASGGICTRQRPSRTDGGVRTTQP